MHKVSFMVLCSALMGNEGFGKDLQAHLDGSYHIVYSAEQSLTLHRDTSQELPECEVFMTEMEELKTSISRCVTGSLQPRTFCNLLKEGLKRKVAGIVNEPFGTVESGVVQYWILGGANEELTQEQVRKYVTSHSLKQDQVVNPKLNLHTISFVDWIADRNSVVGMLQEAPILEWQPDVKVINNYQGSYLQTEDKLLACAMARGDVGVHLGGAAKLTYEIIADEAKGLGEWEFHQELQSNWPASVSPSQAGLLLGFRVTEYLQTVQSEVSFRDVLLFSKNHASWSTYKFELKNFADPFELFRHLPQAIRSVDVDVIAKGKVVE